ncbi:hypothetical protein AURDEDRAFT_178796 [Auricularia subglabra TFB-10046 SS5]|uniref:CCHC-type domain-containing protein n=1 Tax=Auricularia subglabra (strain TFB-10046 / SS5) TaxID=717982 RepID=J0WIR9_AURST|nr:hypothetical protein AURDEDRAFT_178796 [Auricularia subglabra TFB-10046 SS5]
MASTGTFFHMLGLFDKASAFTGSNWAKFKTEFIMTFQSDPDFIGVLDGTVISNAAAVSAAISSASSAPTATPAPATPAVRSRPQRSSCRRRQQHDSDSESSMSDVEDLNWGNVDGDPDACHRCGRHGHRARDCIVNMPRDVKDRIMDEVRNKNREHRKEQRQTRAHHHRSPSSSSSSSDYSSSSASAHRGMYTYTPWHNHKVPRSVAIAVEG